VTDGGEAVSNPGLPNLANWYAVYTQPRHEKKVAQQLAMRSVEAYLPLYESIRRWKDRRTKLNLPLFPGYVFVRMVLQQRLKVLEVPSVVQIVGNNGHPSALPDEDIERLRGSLANRKMEPHPYLAMGKRVRIRSGPLAGLEGTVLRRKGQIRIVISIDAIQRSVVMELETADLQAA
jgi:transcription termination/antitermination protein NusG